MVSSYCRTGGFGSRGLARRLVGLAGLAALAGLVPGVPAATAAQTLTLDEVLFRASQNVVRLEREFGNRLADELYEQRIVSADGEVREVRQLSSSVLFFRAPDADTWTSYRNVQTVDGKGKPRGWIDASDAEPTLREFLAAAARRSRAGTRHYLGDAPRTLHMPLLSLTFLHPLNRYRSNFEKVGEETFAGRPVWVVRFSEHRQPPFVRVGGRRPTQRGRRGQRPGTSTSAGDLFASGTFWIDVEGGHVVRSDLLLGGSVSSVQARTHIAVTFEELDGTGIWVPAEMEEAYDNPLFPEVDRLEGTARYSSFRTLSLQSRERPMSQP